MTSFTWLLGGLGVVAIEASYAPQLLRLYKLKRADEISYLFPGLNFCGRVMALTYSLMVNNSVFTFGFLLGCALRLALLAQVYWYRHGGRRPDNVPAGALVAAHATDGTNGASGGPLLAGGTLR